MEKKDYNNFVKSMHYSHHWYCAEESLAADLRYGIFEPSNELIIEFMEEDGYFYLNEVIKGCEYTKNIDLLYLVGEFVLAKWKHLDRHQELRESFNYLDELSDCLNSLLKTIYRLHKTNIINYEDKRIIRILNDFKNYVNIEKCQGALSALLFKYVGSQKKLSDEANEFISEESNRLTKIKEMNEMYQAKYTRSYNELYSSINFLIEALKEGMITIESNGCIKSPFIEESDFQFDPNIIFNLDESTQACMLKEAIDENKIQVMEGLDFLQPQGCPVKKL